MQAPDSAITVNVAASRAAARRTRRAMIEEVKVIGRPVEEGWKSEEPRRVDVAQDYFPPALPN